MSAAEDPPQAATNGSNGHLANGFFEQLRTVPAKGVNRDQSIACSACGSVTAETERLHSILTELSIENAALKDRIAKDEVRIRSLLSEGDQRRKQRPAYQSALRVLDYWAHTCMPAAREPHSTKRVKAVMDRLEASPNPFTEEELMRCADGYAAFPYMVQYRRVEKGSPGQRSVEATFIFGEAKRVQQGLSLAEEAEQRARPLPAVAPAPAAPEPPTEPAVQAELLATPAPEPAPPAPPAAVQPLGTMASAALQWAERGFAVFPTMPRSKQPLPGSGGLLDATCDPERITRFWKQCPEHNIAVRCGVQSALVVLDVDERSGGLDSLAQLEREYGPLPSTGTVVTPSGGTHYYFRHPEQGEIRNTTGFPLAGLDIRGEGGYVLVPPSVGENGRCYEIDEASARVPLPGWLIKLLAERQVARSTVRRDYAQLVHDGVKKGARNSELLSLAGHLWSHGHGPNEVYELVLAVNKARCSPPLGPSECRRIVESVAKMRSRQALNSAT